MLRQGKAINKDRIDFYKGYFIGAVYADVKLTRR